MSLFCHTTLWFCVARAGCLHPLAMPNHGSVSQEGGQLPLPRHNTMVLCRGQGGPCLLCHTVAISVVSHNGHGCCVLQQTCLRCHAADTSVVSDSRHVCCLTQQTRLLPQTADVRVVSPSRHVSCVTQQTSSSVSHSKTCLLCHTVVDMSAVSHC